MIPKYIQAKIQTHNILLEKTIKLEEEINEWYEKQLTKFSPQADLFYENEVCEIASGNTATFISYENILYNLTLFSGTKKKGTQPSS